MGKNVNKRWKMADIAATLKNSFIAILKGELLLRLNAGRYFVHIAYTFVMIALIIWISLMVESSMAKVEQNNKVIEELEIANSQKTFEVVKLSRRSTVASMLKEMGSKVTEAEAPATVISR